MNKLLPVALLFLTSCASYKVVHLSSEVPKVNDMFVYENDTMKITYHFWAKNGRMTYDLYNKLNSPIYIDWKSSAFILNDRMMSYWRDETNTEGASTGTNIYYGAGIHSNSGKYKAKSVHAERIAVIPPKSMITSNQYVISPKNFSSPKVGTYEEAHTPLRFRNYIVYSTSEKFDGKANQTDNSFFVSSITKVSSMQFTKAKASSSFYYQQ